MIPILYRTDELNFTSNGMGRLADCVSCTVTEERNGIYECEFKYPITGKHYQWMCDNGGVVGCIHDDNHDVQLFEIYAYSAPIDGIVTFNAHHISYRLCNIVAKPFTASSCALALVALGTNATTKCPFTFWTDKTVISDFKLETPDNIRAVLGGQRGSILDVYGKGDYEFDRFDVKLYVNRGINTNATIRYGKNMRDIVRKYDTSGSNTAVVPFWTNGDGVVVTLPEYVVMSPDAPLAEAPWTADDNFMTEDHGEDIWFHYLNIVPIQLDLSQNFEEAPTEEELRTAAQNYLANNQPWVPSDNITVDFVQLWQTPEYENVAILQRFKLCDTVDIFYPELGITQTSAKIIKVVYNVLTEQYDSMEIGTPTTTLAQSIANALDADLDLKNYPSVSFLESAIRYATQKITGGLGGYVVFNNNANGEPQEILIMDTDDIYTAVNVIRMNKNGIGFSQTGYEGPFTSAWTIDGRFNADFIASGTILANFIHGGTLALGGYNNQGGVISMLDADGNEVGSWNNGFLRADYLNGYLLAGANGLHIHAFQTDIFGAADTGNHDIGGLILQYKTSDASDYRKYRLYPGLFECVNAHGTGNDYTVDSRVMYNLDFPYPFNIPTTKVNGDFLVTGTKSRGASADDYGDRKLYCYETPSPLFGDVGEGLTDETGVCYVFIDPVLAETIVTEQYQVFLQVYGSGNCYVSERKHDYFVVTGDPQTAFGWELKAKQKGYDQMRLERVDSFEEKLEKPQYGSMGVDYYIELEEGRMTA